MKLVPFNPQYQDESVLWTESGDVGKGFRCIRMVNNIHLNFDAFHGDKDHGGVHDGTGVVLWEWAKGDNQRWKILPWGDEAYAGGSAANAPHGGHGHGEPTVRIYCKADEGFSVTVRNGAVCLAPTNPRDEFQHWIKDMRHSNSIKDEEGYPAFALVNRVTGEAIKHSLGEGHQVSSRPSINLVSYCASSLDLIAFERRDQEVIFVWLRLSTDGWIVLQRGTHR